jgi:uncharacterized repeat protein (TIGR01451 family)
MKKILKLFLLLLLALSVINAGENFIIDSEIDIVEENSTIENSHINSGEGLSFSSKATAIFKENGVSKFLYSNEDYSKTGSKQRKREDITRDNLWLSFESVSKSVVGMGEFVQYRLKIENSSEVTIKDTVVEIQLPRGFKYVEKSYKVDNKSLDKIEIKDEKLFLPISRLNKKSNREIKFILQVGVASMEKATVIAVARATDINSNIVSQTIIIKNSELMRDKSTVVGQVIAEGVPVEGVRLYMEDGTFTLTDKDGQYNFVALDRGTHVVKLDKASLSDKYSAGSCEESVRFAGSRVSQFIKTFSGTLHRSDFCLGIKEEYKQSIRLHPQFNTLDDKLDFDAREKIANALIEIDPLNISSILLEGHSDNQKIRAGNRFKNNYELALARAKSVKKYVAEYLNISLDKIKVISHGDREPISSNRTKSGRAKNRRVDMSVIKIRKEGDTEPTERVIIDKKRVKMPIYDEEWLIKQSKKSEFVWPTREFVPSVSAVDLAVKHREEYITSFTLNGKAIDRVHFNKKLIDDDGKALTVYKGVHIKEGDNLVVCEIKDKSHKVIKRLTKSVHYSTMPVRAEIIKEQARFVADGKRTPVLAVKFFDKSGYPVRADVIGKFKISQPYRGYRQLDALGRNPLSKSTTGEDYVIGDGGIAYIQLEPTSKAGEATLSLPFSDRTEELKVWLKPKVRDWILVGFAEGSVGYSTITKNMEDAKLKGDSEVSLFAKGRVLGSYLMTIAYSSRDKKRELMDIIDPNRYYTIYGDSSIRGVEAPSQKSLYLKIEKDNFYGMFGDFVTGLNDMKLSTYDRTLNGVKAEYNGKRIQATAFGSDSDQSFVKDEIRGDGTSGLYRLSHKNIIINSEKITVETRDRFQPDRVLKKESLSTLLDYNIDYFKGTIYFKKPISSRDRDFNPIYIVVNYEIKSIGESLSAGARVSVNLFDEKMKLSSTYIKEDLGEENAQLASVDMRLRVGEKGKLEVEYAKSTSTETIGQQSAVRVNYEHNGENFYTNSYYKKVESGFGLRQQNSEDLNLEKIGLESSYKVDEDTEATAKIYRDKRITKGEITDIAEATVKHDIADILLEGGVRYINEHNEKEPTEQIIAGASRGFFNDKLTLHAKREESIKSDDREEYPDRTLIGAEIQVTDKNSIFIEQELIDNSKRITKVGVESEPWSGARVQTSVGDKVADDGDRLFSSIGIIQSIKVNENINVDLGLDRVDSIEGETSDDFTSYTSSINYYKDGFSSSLKTEYKKTNEEDSISLATALSTELNDGLELATSAQYFKSDNGDEAIYADVSLSYRPVETDYIILDKFHFLDERGEDLQNRKFVNDFNLNYKITSTFELSFYHGIKYIIDTIEREKYNGVVQMFGLRANYDINSHFDIMVYSNVIHGALILNQQEYNHGIALGWNAYKNLNLLVGYNFEGFEERDFDSGTKTKEGAYIGFRMKF